MKATIPLTGIIMSASIVQLEAMGILVSRARKKYNIQPPATTGDPHFEKIYRAHANTMEHTVIFIPSLLAFGSFVDDRVGAALGITWLIGRLLYAKGYMQEPEKRALGYKVAFGAECVLVGGSFLGAIINYLMNM
eukprot:GEZU01009114.1.p1 GENE.GEZU01009114.1~~GEZU01009114.1.p1  ORF type:complete len:135 (+),score=25.41 GEZU01009114.1:122-526(+)